MVNDEQRLKWARRAAMDGRVRRVPCLVAGVVLGAMVAGGAESGRFVVRRDAARPGVVLPTGICFCRRRRLQSWVCKPAGVTGRGGRSREPDDPDGRGGVDADGNSRAFVTSSGAIYSFDEATAFRVDYTAAGVEPVTSVIFQTLTGGRRLDIDAIRLNYTTTGGEVISLAPRLKALDDPQTGAFAERLVSAFQWDVSGRDVRSFRLVFGAPGSSMPLWESQLDVVRGGAFEPELGYVLLKQSWPVVRYQTGGRVVPVVPAGGETRFFRSGATVRLQGAPASGFGHAGWWHDGVVSEGRAVGCDLWRKRPDGGGDFCAAELRGVAHALV